MAKKKRKRTKPPETGFSATLRRNTKWVRRLAVTASLIGVLVAVWFIADPLGGAPTAIDENGEEVSVGLIGRDDAGEHIDGQASNFLLPDYDGRAVRLADFEGKTVFLNFWASWCAPCRAEMPEIIRIAEQFPDDVVVLAVNRGESVETAQRWTENNGFRQDLPNFYWLSDSREIVYREFREGNNFPQSLFLDGSGVVRSDARGALTYDQMASQIETARNFGGDFIIQ